MNKNDFCREIVAELKRNGKRKPMARSSSRNKLYIHDDYGNEKTIEWSVPLDDVSRAYTNDDVTEIIGTAIVVILKALQRGESVSIRGFGELCVNYREARTVTNVADGVSCKIDGHYVPKFFPGTMAKNAAKRFNDGHQHKSDTTQTTTKDAEEYCEEFDDYFFELTGINLIHDGGTA